MLGQGGPRDKSKCVCAPARARMFHSPHLISPGLALYVLSDSQGGFTMSVIKTIEPYWHLSKDVSTSRKLCVCPELRVCVWMLVVVCASMLCACVCV